MKIQIDQKSEKITFCNVITSLVLTQRPWNFFSTLVLLFSTSKKVISLTLNRPSNHITIFLIPVVYIRQDVFYSGLSPRV